MKVLIAEADAKSRERLQATLAKWGIDARTVASGEDTLEQVLCTDGPWIVLISSELPGKDGLSVCKEVRSSARSQSIYVILRGKSPSPQAIARGLDAGADDYFPESCPRTILRARIRLAERALRTRHALAEQAMHDPLTMLPNRAFIIERLKHCAQQASRTQGQHFTVLLVNIDRFKVVNDSLGHAAGNALMKKIAQRMLETVRATPARSVGDDRRQAHSGCEDTVARLDGDEFVILLEKFGGLQHGVAIASRVNEALMRGFSLNGEKIVVSASIGISTNDAAVVDPSATLRGAGAAMSKAKLLGGARYEINVPDHRTAALSPLKLENDLRRAVQGGELEVYYQPIVDLSKSHITRFEALMRWNHPRLGFIPPSSFIPLAEETGLILPMGTALLRAACRQMKAWNSSFSPPASVCVNISPRQFTEASFAKQVREALDESGLDSESLDLEVTENLTMQNANRAEQVLRELVNCGISVSLDDFGTGYSSLSYLLRLPIRTLKIDRSFVAGIEQSPESLAIIQTIISLGHSLGMKVAAEGIETVAQLELLRQLRCDFGQGYLFSPAVAPEKALELFARSRLSMPLNALAATCIAEVGHHLPS